jgi:glycolate oxidase subunit GlcD
VTLSTTALQALRRAAPGVQLISDPVELLTYEIDAGMDRGVPDAVAFPRSAADVAAIVHWAGANGVPIVARGAGTGLSGGAVAAHGGLIVCFAHMKRLVEIDPAQRRAVVQPGLINAELDLAARAHGLAYPPDPASGQASTLGGNLAENAGGPHCFKYGVTRNYVTELQVALADGRLVRLGGAAADIPEYEFIGVLIGNEGTLGLITEARLSLLPQTTHYKTLITTFDTVEEACQAVSAIIAAGLVPAALEMIEHKLIGIIEAYAHAGLPIEAEAALVIEVDGYPESVTEQMDEIVDILQANGARSLQVAQSDEQRAQIWKARKSVGGAVARLAPAYCSLDATVPRSRLAETLHALNAVSDAAGLRVGYVMHAGDGNLHPQVLIDDPTDAALVAHVLDTARQMMAVCANLGGSITGEHGVGIEKRPFMTLMYGAAELAAMQDIKAVFDPAGLLNPGKIFPEPLPAQPASKTAPSAPPSVRPAYCAPASAIEAAEALHDWAHDCPPGGVRIRGGGTQSSWLPPAGALLSSEALRGISTYAPADLYVVAKAGTPLADLQAELSRNGVWVPLVSPWPTATVGGIISTNLNAPLRMRYGYGAIRDQMLAATVVLPDGTLVHAGRPLVKNVAGYDLAQLFVGAQGTLGFLVDVTLKLSALPRQRRTLAFPVQDLAQAQTWAARLLRLGLVASALLLCRNEAVPKVPAPYVLIYTAEGWPGDVNAEIAAVQRVLGAEAGQGRTLSESGSAFWATWLAAAGDDGVIMRAGVAPKDVTMLLNNAALAGVDWLADLASGLVYLRGVPAIQAVQRVAGDLGGYACILRAPAGPPVAVTAYHPDTWELMAALKARWDPAGYLNPGAMGV